MKKTLWIVGALVVAGLAAFLILRPKTSEITQPEPQNQVQSASAVVTPLSADVSIREENKSNFRVIGEATSTVPGTSVRTSSQGRAIIESSFSHPTALDYSSEIVIKDSNSADKKTTLQLNTGSMWARAKKLVEKGEFYEIKTGNAVAVVRGTSFGLTYKDNKSTLIVKEGEVSFYNKDKTTGEPIEGTEVVVEAGNKAVIDGDKKAVESPIAPEDVNSDWYVFNNTAEQDTTYDAGGTHHTAPTPTPNKNPGTTTGTNNGTTGSGTGQGTGNTNATGGGNTSGAGTVVGGGASGGGDVAPVKVSSFVVTVSSVSPKTINAGDTNTWVVLRGSGFKNVVDIAGGELLMKDLTIVSDNILQFHIDPELSPNLYDLDLILSDETLFTVSSALTVQSSLRSVGQ
jgi:hypothetical protein